MEGEVCMHNKFGHCKYKTKCLKMHYVKECKDLSKCKSVQSCHLRHPKACKKFAARNCRYGNDCDYNHKLQIKTNEQCELKDKIFMLEDKVEEMAQKLFTLETEVKEMKQEKTTKLIEKENQTEKVLKAMTRKVLELESEMKIIKKNNFDKVKENAKEKEECTKNFLTDDVSFDNEDIKKSTSTPKEKKEEVIEHSDKVGLLSCESCKYTCKKETSLKKHMLTKHEEHQCKECQEKLPTFMDLLKHVTKLHYTDPSSIQGEQSEEETNNKKDE